MLSNMEHVIITPDGSTTTFIGSTTPGTVPTTTGMLPSDYLFPSDLAASTTPKPAPANMSAATAYTASSTPSPGVSQNATSSSASIQIQSVSSTTQASSTQAAGAENLSNSSSAASSSSGGIVPNPPNLGGTPGVPNTGAPLLTAQSAPGGSAANPGIVLLVYIAFVAIVVFAFMRWARTLVH